MNAEELKIRAEERLRQARQTAGAADPVPLCRSRLRELKNRDGGAYAEALEYFNKRLLPAVADDASDPVAEWLEYSRLLAELTAHGQTMQVDRTGKSAPYTPPVPADHLVLHMPTSSKEPVLVVAEPAELSPAQRATHDLLVGGALE